MSPDDSGAFRSQISTLTSGMRSSSPAGLPAAADGQQAAVQQHAQGFKMVQVLYASAGTFQAAKP
jgi:hypothetical protein